MKFKDVVEEYITWLEDNTQNMRSLHNPNLSFEDKVKLMRHIGDNCHVMADFLEMDVPNESEE